MTGVLAWWAADAPADVVDGRVTASADVIGGRVAARNGQNRVGPELVLVGGRPRWRFGGAASPANLLAPAPTLNGTPYSWVFVTTRAGQGQMLAPVGTGSSAQLLVEENATARWQAFAGANLFLAQPTGEHLVVVDHDGGSGATRLYAGGTRSTATLQRRSLTGEVHFGRHGSNDRPLLADVAAILLVDHWPTDAELRDVLEPWRADGAPSQTAAVTRAVLARSSSRSAPTARTTPRRATPAATTARSRAVAAATARRLTPAPSTSRSRAAAATTTRRATPAPTAARSRPRATTVARRLVVAATAARSAATALSARLGSVLARTATTTTTAAAMAPLRAVRARTVTRSTPTAATRPRRLNEALARSWSTTAALVRALVARPTVPTTTDGDLVARLGPPQPGWQLHGPAAGRRLGPPAGGWRLDPPTHQPGGDPWS